MTSKTHAVVDALGNPIHFVITAGQWADSPQARRLVEGLDGVGHVIADPADDADQFRHFVDENRGATAQIPSNPSHAGTLPIDPDLNEARHLVENFYPSNTSAALPRAAKRRSLHAPRLSHSPAH